MTDADLTRAVLDLTGKVGEMTATVADVRREMTQGREANAVEHKAVLDRLGRLEKVATVTNAVADVKRGIFRNPYLLTFFNTALILIVGYIGIANDASTKRIEDTSVQACQATQDLRNRAITGLTTSLADNRISQRYYDSAVGQLPPKSDCHNP